MGTPKMDPATCDINSSNEEWQHRVYQVYQDGLDIGREVRTTFPSKGPLGEEEITISHLMTRHKSHDVEIDRFVIQTERFLKTNNTFLRGSFILIDEASVHLSLVGFNGATWEKLQENLDSVESPISKTPTHLHLNGDELIGYQLHKHLQKIALDSTEDLLTESRTYFLPKLAAPVKLDFSISNRETHELNGQKINGFWVSALRSGTRRVVIKAFVGENGTIYEEQYPALHQQRIRTTANFTLPTEYTNPYRGLFSNAYLGYADSATNATYRIVAKQPISLEDFSFISEPANQTISRVDPNTLELKITAGGPDGTDPPTKKDLSATQYINTDAKGIRDALNYLKSGGKRGFLPRHRRENAVPVMAKAIRIRNPGKFWGDPDKVAQLISEYVHALLPIKLHTHTMKSAEATLKDGLGDCTEHSVLFAALLRAANIPTKLVSGMYLAHGGSWVFHMWNEYWDGDRWNSIDTAVGPKLRPSAAYVALSRGAADFEEHRHNISFFLDRSFSGLEFNLVEAGAQGETLHLARPKRIAFSGNDAVIFEALTLSNRGDYQTAFDFVQKHFNPDSAPLNLELLRADLFFKMGKHREAMRQIELLRKKTSLPMNVFMLDKLSFDLHIRLKNIQRAKEVLERMAESLGDNEPLYLQHKAKFLFADGQTELSLRSIDNALITEEYNTQLIATYVELAAQSIETLSEQSRRTAIDRAWSGLYLTHYASPSMLKSAAALFYSLHDFQKAIPLIQHALIMTPNDEELNKWLMTSTYRCK